MTLLPQESDHLDAFRGARPEWKMVAIEPRVHDECDGSRTHKYPKSHPYLTGMKYVLETVREMAPCSVLDIGSPIAQNVALACMPGVDVTVLDVRPHDDAEMLGLKWKHATATALPFDDGSLSLVTSLWVMGHVGDGRYGDALRVDGDVAMLSEVARVLRSGGIAIIGPGLVDERAGNIFNLHRIYSWEWLRAEFDRAGFEVLEEVNLPVSDEWFIADRTMQRRDGAYALSLLRKR